MKWSREDAAQYLKDLYINNGETRLLEITGEQARGTFAVRAFTATSTATLGGFTSMSNLASRIAFFRLHMGYNYMRYSYPEKATRRQKEKARNEAAEAYALAEMKAEELGLVITWEPDECEPFDDDGNAQSVVCAYAAKDAELEYPSLVNVHRGAKPLGVLGGVSKGDRNWERTIRVQVFMMALEMLDNEAQEAADELASRATYAAG